MITRIAPTPSGYLHMGNCVNFLLTSWLRLEHGGTLALRIDDMDADRYRPEYVDDTFRILDWLGIEWNIGPRDTLEFESHFALRDRTEAYRIELARLIDSNLSTYACACSRSAARAVGSTGCVADCRGKDLALDPGVTALRLHVPLGTSVTVGDHVVDLHAAMGDFVIWRRDDRPSYQLASLVEDRDLGTTHLVRGEDLLPSSAAQVFLARALGADSFAQGTFLHHPLVRDERGEKLSKSQLAAGPLATSAHSRDMLVEQATALAGALGMYFLCGVTLLCGCACAAEQIL